jgi:poly(3-hydroxybutyrate) depolymerase
MDEVIEFWVDIDGCDNSENILLSNMNTIKHRYYDCIDNTEIWLYEVVNGGHDWPSYSSQEIWNFFTHFIDSSNADINSDGQINVADVVVLVSMVLGTVDVSTNADLNADGLVNVQDVIILVNIILGV